MSESARTRLASLVVLLVVFAAGGILGAALDRTLTAGTPTGESVVDSDDGDRLDRDDDDDGDRPRRQALWERVEPNEVQRDEIGGIIRGFRNEMDALQDEFSAMYNPRYWAIIDSTRNSIRDVLNEEQRAQYDSLTNRFDERARDRDAADGRFDGPRDDDGSDSDDGRSDDDSGTAGSGDDNAGDSPDIAASSEAETAEPRSDRIWMDDWVVDARRDPAPTSDLSGGSGND